MSVMCPACQAINAGSSGVEPHPRLGHQGFTNPSQKGREANREDHFRCIECGAKWLRRPIAGAWTSDSDWRLEGRATGSRQAARLHFARPPRAVRPAHRDRRRRCSSAVAGAPA